MSSSKDINNEDLKKLEDEAYFELCQIIAEALENQDVELLDARIATWKNKYKKLLDRPATSSKSDFKKRIEFLLTQYYSSVTQYILNQLKLKEEKKIENQSKAMRELYKILRDTKDYDLLKVKVKKWKEKYPISGFLRMYQKRIELYTRDKNLKENAFKQEEAFSNLVDITKKNGTLSELKEELTLWEKKYSINDKYTIDDFIKHQSEVKRFTSDEFLISIAKDDPNDVNPDELLQEYNNRNFSDISVQSNSYKTLEAIASSPNNVNAMFEWVYKNRCIKFNDWYKNRILTIIDRDYRPTYLNQLPSPKLNSSNFSLSFEEYTNINDIKRYAIISYFNLLLPQNMRVSNDYFNKNIQSIYSKSEKVRLSKISDDSTTYIEDDILNDGEETPLILHHENTSTTVHNSDDENISVQVDLPNNDSLTQVVLPVEDDTNQNDLSDETTQKTPEISEPTDNSAKIAETSGNIPKPLDKLEVSQATKDDTELPVVNKNDTKEIDESEKSTLPQENPSIQIDLSSLEEKSSEEVTIHDSDDKEPILAFDFNSNSIFDNSAEGKDDSEPEVTYDTVVALSPLLFTSIYTHVSVVNTIDKHVTEYVKSEVERESNYDLDKSDTILKTRNNMD